MFRHVRNRMPFFIPINMVGVHPGNRKYNGVADDKKGGIKMISDKKTLTMFYLIMLFANCMFFMTLIGNSNDMFMAILIGYLLIRCGELIAICMVNIRREIHKQEPIMEESLIIFDILNESAKLIGVLAVIAFLTGLKSTGVTREIFLYLIIGIVQMLLLAYLRCNKEKSITIMKAQEVQQ